MLSYLLDFWCCLNSTLWRINIEKNCVNSSWRRPSYWRYFCFQEASLMSYVGSCSICMNMHWIKAWTHHEFVISFFSLLVVVSDWTIHSEHSRLPKRFSGEGNKAEEFNYRIKPYHLVEKQHQFKASQPTVW